MIDKKQFITQNIIPQNKEMEVLKKHFSHCFDKNGNFQFDKFKQSLSEQEINFSKESYTMDWLGKSYARLLASDAATTLLKEDTVHNQKEENKEAENLLLKGDNLEVLKHLTNAYYEKVKMIYIDPPYNTGGDGFVYQDDRKFSVEELQELAGIDEERAKRILDFTQSKSNSHSAWLTFMYPRLYVAKQLLREDGVIFISIDDNEVAQLKLLMDEIFGEENFESLITWRRRHNQPNDKSKMVAKVAENILVYAKNSDKLKSLNTYYGVPLSEKRIKQYTNSDNDSNGPWTTNPWKAAVGRGGTRYKIINPAGIEYDETWYGSKESFLKLLEDKKVHWSNNGEGLPRIKIYLKEALLEGQAAINFFTHQKYGSNQEGTEEINNLFKSTGIFSNPKPVRLISSLGKLSTRDSDIIVDFFAGSGTTGDAVMQLNAEDGGNRKFILVQLPEALDKKKDKAAYDFVKNELEVDEPTIFEITKERLLRAAKKINKELDDKNKELQTEIAKLKQELPTEETQEKIQELEEEITQNKNQQTQNVFKIFETQPIWEDYELEVDKLDSQTKLFDESKLTEDDVQSLLITWKTNDGLALTEDLKPVDLGDYTGYYGQDKLYLMHKGFSTENLKEILLKIDQDKSFNPTSIIAFGYHFESKNLREIAENVKSYSNKKNVDVDFIIRY